MAKKAEFSIETVKKYVFWVCVPLGVLIAAITSFLAVGKVGQAFNSQKNALNTQKQTVEKIRTESDHPNEKTITQIEDRSKELRGRVQQAWTTLEKDQRERNKWPTDVGASFNNEVSRLKFGDEISVDSRELYLNFAERYLPKLEYNVDRRRMQVMEDGEWQEIDPLKSQRLSGAMSGGDPHNTLSQLGSSTMDGGAMSGGGSESGGAGFQPKLSADGEPLERMVGVVDWPNPETRLVVASWQSLPKSNEVWFAQEELWVYAALLSVIKESNTGATGPHNAAVKRIENILIGQAASMQLYAQLNQRVGAAAGGMDGGMGMDSGMSMSGGSGMDGGMSGGMSGGMDGGSMIARTEDDVITLKKHFRYVDDAGQPLASDADAPFAQFSRMPVVLRLIVDQRKIPEILVSCANCAMPIDVLRVRLNPGAAKPFELTAYEAAAGMSGGEDGMSGGMSGGSMGSMGSSSGGGMSSDVGYGGGARGGMGGASGGDEKQVQLDGVGGMYGSNAVPIEIYGCISIFQPVEHGMTQVESGSAEEAE